MQLYLDASRGRVSLISFAFSKKQLVQAAGSNASTSVAYVKTQLDLDAIRGNLSLISDSSCHGFVAYAPKSCSPLSWEILVSTRRRQGHAHSLGGSFSCWRVCQKVMILSDRGVSRFGAYATKSFSSLGTVISSFLLMGLK